MKPPVLAAVLTVLAAGASRAAEPPELPETGRVDGHPVRTVLEPEAIPAIDDPAIVAASEAALLDDEPVLGVVVGGEARAYSLAQLDGHEIVNDQLGGRPVAVTW